MYKDIRGFFLVRGAVIPAAVGYNHPKGLSARQGLVKRLIVHLNHEA